jgi:Zn-dependent alcohol dehydrogenase
MDQGKIKLNGFVTEVRPFSQINETITLMKSAAPGRFLVKF